MECIFGVQPVPVQRATTTPRYDKTIRQEVGKTTAVLVQSSTAAELPQARGGFKPT